MNIYKIVLQRLEKNHGCCLDNDAERKKVAKEVTNAVVTEILLELKRVKRGWLNNIGSR